MNDRLAKLSEIVDTLPQLGMSIPDATVEGLRDLENPAYRIAVVGRFQTGKSHLINEVFLGDELLAEGVGLCTTVATTEIVYGESPRLIVDYKNGEPTKIIDNPNVADICESVSAYDSSKRIEMAAAVKKARLEWPSEALRKLTILDTAGIDDPNHDLLRATTYRTIPETDGVVMVIAAKSLSAIELDFLKGSIFSLGLSRVMILVSYRHGMDALSDIGREKLLEGIRGQLSAIGREDIPVKMICYGREIAGDDILCTTDEIREAIVQFAEESAFGNRLEKIAVVLKKIVGDHIAELRFQQQLVDKSSHELASIRAKIVDLAEQLRQERENLRVRFDATAAAVCEDATLAFRAQCDAISRQYCVSLSECIDFAKTQERVLNVQAELMPPIENAAVHAFDMIRFKISEEVARYGTRMSELCANCELGSCEVPSALSVNGGWCGRWNATAVTVGDYLLTIFLLPGGFFMGWCLRYIIGRLPYVQCIVPSALIAAHVVAKVRESLAQSVEEMEDQFGQGAKCALDKLRDDMYKIVTDEIDALMDRAVYSVKAIEDDGFRKDVPTIDNELGCCLQIINELNA